VIFFDEKFTTFSKIDGDGRQLRDGDEIGNPRSNYRIIIIYEICRRIFPDSKIKGRRTKTDL